MNDPIAHVPLIEDGDLMLDMAQGMAWQRDMSAGRVIYNDAYFRKYLDYENTAVGIALNAGRLAMLKRHCPAHGRVLDYGAGCGTFVRLAREAGYRARGYDINPATVEALAKMGAYSEAFSEFDTVTFWDSLEHIECPERALSRIHESAHVLAAIPIFVDLRRIRESKHYRPGEHLYYWTPGGFIGWMKTQGFRFLEGSGHEVEAGRASIGAFAFVCERHQS